MAQANGHDMRPDGPVGTALTERAERAVTLGRHVAATRSATYGTTRLAHAATQISRNTWAAVETGSPRIRSDTYARIEKALGWPNGSCVAYLDAVGPLPCAPADDGPAGALATHSLDDLPEVISSEFTTYGVMDPGDRARRLQEIVYGYVQEANALKENGP